MKRLASYFDDDKAQALADYLEVDVENIEGVDDYFDGYDEIVYEVDGKQYRVLDEDEAHIALEHYIEQLIDEIGLQEFLDYSKIPFDVVLDNNEENLRDWFYEDYCDYAIDIEDEENEEYGNRLNQECIEYGLIDEDEIEDGEYVGDEDLVELLAECLTDKLEGNFAEELMFSFNDDFVIEIINEYCDIDYPAMADWSLNLNNYGNWLSPIDGETMELDGYYGFLVRD